MNSEGKNLGHISSLIGANKCSKYLRDKFQVSFKASDNYGFTAEKYQEIKIKKQN